MTRFNALVMDAILKNFHADTSSEDREKLRERAWSRHMLRLRLNAEIIKDCACSWIVLTMHGASLSSRAR